MTGLTRVFYKHGGLPHRYFNRLEECRKLTKQCEYLPPITFNGESTYFQLSGRVTNNAATAEWANQVNLGQLCNMFVNSDREQYGIQILFPTSSPDREDVSLLVSWNEVFYYPKSVFVMSDIPFKVNLAQPFRDLSKNPPA